jgi:dTDP-4-amino-4,6-dideoxygalactose transaminase
MEILMSVQLFVPHFRIEECLKEIKICLEKGWTGLGFKTVEFEEAWKEYTHLTHAHFLSSNTAGLHLALEVFKRRYNWSEEDEILTTSLTFISTNHAILQANLKPIFVDTDEYLCIDPQKIDAHITPKTKAVMFVGIGGNTGQLEKVIEICKKRNLKIILDAAHMSGTRHRGIHVGSNVDVTIFSFQAVKNLATADSGMICFAKKEDDELARKMSWLGINKDTYARTTVQGSYKWMYDVEEVGYKYNGNSIMAAIGLVQLKYLDQDNSYRRQLAHWYREGLSSNNKLNRFFC